MAKPVKKAAPKAKPLKKPAKPAVTAKSAAAPAKAKKAKPEAAKVEAKKPVKKVAPVPAPKAPAKAPKPTDKKAKKAKQEKEAFEADEPLVDEEFVDSDELAEYADEVEAATREEDDEDTAPAVVVSEDPDAAAASDEIVLTDADGRKYCRVKDCDQAASVEGYCRYHYLLLWKKIQVRKKILSEGKLERYVEELTARYPDKYLEMIRKDLKTEKDFVAAIQELEIDDSGMDAEFEDEAQSYLDEVRGIGGTGEGAREEEEF